MSCAARPWTLSTCFGAARTQFQWVGRSPLLLTSLNVSPQWTLSRRLGAAQLSLSYGITCGQVALIVGVVLCSALVRVLGHCPNSVFSGLDGSFLAFAHVFERCSSVGAGVGWALPTRRC